MKNIAFAFPMHYRTIALATTIALLAWTLGLPAMVHKANADTVEFFTDTLSDSDRGMPSNHIITFTTSNAMDADESFRIYFDEVGSNFDLSGLGDADLISVNSAGFTPVNACNLVDDDEIDLSVGTNYIEGTVCSGGALGDTIPAGIITIAIDGANKIENPNPGAGIPTSYVISLQGNGATPIADSGDTRVAIIDDVTVTADVDTIFTFTIQGVAAAQAVNDDAVVTSGISTATEIPFGTIAPGAGNAKLMAQELSVDTNALNGFSVSVFADTTLLSGNGATIDAFIDAGETAIAQAWTPPANTIGDPDTFGHWGLTSDDNVVSGATPDRWGIGSSAYVGNFIGSTNPVEVFYHDDPVTSLQGGTGVGNTMVAYKVEIGVMQEAAKDYTATLTYIATPIF